MCFGDEAQRDIMVAQNDGNLTKLTIARSGGLTASNVTRRICVPTRGGLMSDVSHGQERILSMSEDGTLEILKLEDPDGPDRRKITVPAPIENCAYQQGVIAFGGRHNDLKLFNLAVERVSWRAQNVDNNFLNMRQPIYVAATCFWRPDTPNMIAVGTGHGHLRVYDLRGPKKPVIDTKVTEYGDCRPTCIAKHHKFFESEVMLGDTMGNIYCVETRKCAKRVVTSGKLRPSSTGSIRAMALHPQQPCIASAGLGRKVLVHDIRERALITKAYGKHKMTAVLFSKEPAFIDKYRIGRDGNVYDDLWNYLDSAKKRKTKSANDDAEDEEKDDDEEGNVNDEDAEEENDEDEDGAEDEEKGKEQKKKAKKDKAAEHKKVEEVWKEVAAKEQEDKERKQKTKKAKRKCSTSKSVDSAPAGESGDGNGVQQSLPPKKKKRKVSKPVTS
uniref:Guanine nucleotide-binding protein subunit beta-like protein n=1 Tax=Eutreptiella gymnastica TaxID=73025 RepID=A0A6T2BWM3_9EUGL